MRRYNAVARSDADKFANEEIIYTSLSRKLLSPLAFKDPFFLIYNSLLGEIPKQRNNSLRKDE